MEDIRDGVDDEKELVGKENVHGDADGVGTENDGRVDVRVLVINCYGTNSSKVLQICIIYVMHSGVHTYIHTSICTHMYTYVQVCAYTDDEFIFV